MKKLYLDINEVRKKTKFKNKRINKIQTVEKRI